MSSTDHEPLVQCRDVRKSFVRGAATVEVLQGIDLDVEDRDFVAMMGPSGSGKTTLLNLIGGLDQPSSGVVRVAGLAVSEASARDMTRWRAAHVGFVFQFYHLLPALSAQRNVELPLLLTELTRKQRQRHAEVALDIVGLGDRAGHKPGELSGGQQQRVAIARAIVADPELLVCDEPTGDLDRVAADATLDLLMTLNRDHHKTIIMVTHDPRAAAYARTTFQMDKGRLINESAPSRSAA